MDNKLIGTRQLSILMFPRISPLLGPQEPLQQVNSPLKARFTTLNELFSQNQRAELESVVEQVPVTPFIEFELHEMMLQILEKLTDFSFNPIITEFSYFEQLKNVNAEQARFLAITHGPQCAEAGYTLAMRQNLKRNKKFGPIVPSTKLYELPYWISQFDKLTTKKAKAGLKDRKGHDLTQSDLVFSTWQPTIYGYEEDSSSSIKQVASYIRHFHAHLRAISNDLGILESQLVDLIIIPFMRESADGRPTPGGALITVGRFIERRDANFIRGAASTLSRILERSISVEARRQQENAELERLRMIDWMCFCFGSAHAFKSQEDAYLSILDRTQEYIGSGNKTIEQIQAGLDYIRDSTIERTEFFKFLVWLSRILTSDQSDYPSEDALKKIFGDPFIVENGTDWKSYVEAQVRSAQRLRRASERAFSPTLNDGTREEFLFGDTFSGNSLSERGFDIIDLSDECIVHAEIGFRMILRELLNNAIKNSSGQSKLSIVLGPAQTDSNAESDEDEVVELRIWNDFNEDVLEPGCCPTCKNNFVPPSKFYVLAGYYDSENGTDMEASLFGECEYCFHYRLRKQLKKMFKPGFSRYIGQGGSGLGLFFVQFVVQTVYRGTIENFISNVQFDPIEPERHWGQDCGVCMILKLKKPKIGSLTKPGTLDLE